MNFFKTGEEEYEDLSENKNEYTKVVLYVNKDLNNKVFININKSFLYSNRLYPKIEIKKDIFDVFGIELTHDNIDIIRTTPEYAAHFNNIIGSHLDNNELIKTPYMKNYTDGYSFLGEAFINFVTALAVYEMFPDETSASLTTFSNLFRNNVYIAEVYSNFEIANLLSKVRKDQQTKKKTSKQLASSFKGLVGMMFVQHGNSKMIDIMKFVNSILIPNNKVDFTGKEAINSITDISIMLFGLACVMFGWLLCYTMIVLDPITTCKISL